MNNDEQHAVLLLVCNIFVGISSRYSLIWNCEYMMGDLAIFSDLSMLKKNP